jgi:hypothetical protein
MRISESMVYMYCREGRYGAQIPTIVLELPSGGGNGGTHIQQSDMRDMPDDWFLRTDSQNLPTTSKNSYYLFWTRKGLKENEERLRAEFKTAKGFRTGDDYDYKMTFDQWMRKCYDDCDRHERLLMKKITSMRKKLALYEQTQQSLMYNGYNNAESENS